MLGRALAERGGEATTEFNKAKAKYEADQLAYEQGLLHPTNVEFKTAHSLSDYYPAE